MNYKQIRIINFALTLCTMLLIGSSSYAQFDDEDVYLRIYGSIADNDNSSRLENCIVKVLKDGEFSEDYTTKGSGKFEFFLPAGYNYRFYFDKDGYVGKNIQISTVEAASMEEQFIFSLKADISLFKSIEGMNYDVLDEPIGMGNCNGRKGKVQFDKEYTRDMENKIAQIYVPIVANTSQTTRVSLEETITEVPEEDDNAPTVEEIFTEAENEDGLLALEEIDTSKLEIVNNEPKVYEIIDTPVDIPHVEVADIEVVNPKIEKEEIVVEEVAKVKTSIVDDIIIPVKIVESEPYTEDNTGLVWRVQVGAFTSINANEFNGLRNVDFVDDKNGITRCVVGAYDNPMDAAKEKVRLVNAGYKDAFLTVYKDQERIHIKDAGVNLAHISYAKIKEEINE